MYKVIVLKEGYSIPEGPGQQKACGTITLLKGPKNIIVDTGNPWDKDLILEGLDEHHLLPSDIMFIICTNGHSDKVGNLNLFTRATHIIAGEVLSGLKKHEISADRIHYVVCTHGHSDHVGNNNLFQHATHIMSHDICHGDTYMMHSFSQGIPYEIDDFVAVVPTAGHTGSDVSVVVKNTDMGTVAITGDLFECFEDLENPDLWQSNSEKPEVQEQSRINILRIADVIIPGHGKMFHVPENYKQQMRVVMFYEEFTKTSEDGASMTTSEYLVWEEDDSTGEAMSLKKSNQS